MLKWWDGKNGSMSHPPEGPSGNKENWDEREEFHTFHEGGNLTWSYCFIGFISSTNNFRCTTNKLLLTTGGDWLDAISFVLGKKKEVYGGEGGSAFIAITFTFIYPALCLIKILHSHPGDNWGLLALSWHFDGFWRTLICSETTNCSFLSIVLLWAFSQWENIGV